LTGRAKEARVPDDEHPSKDALLDTSQSPVLGLIGGFELRCGGAPVPLPLTAQRLVAFLALQPRPVTRLYVACTLWLDSGEEQAKGCLRSALWRTQRSGLELVRTAGGHLSLDPDLELDVAHVTELAHRALEGPGVLRDDEVHALADAGDLLPDWYDDWLAIERERLRQLRLHALEATCERLAGTRRFGAAVEAGLSAVATEPLRESAHRALIRVHLAEGNLGEALRQYESYRSLLDRELHAEPTDELRALIAPVHGTLTLR
jgi:DNA-binding SARP family transcriptional activator